MQRRQRGGIALWMGLGAAAALTFSCAIIVGIDDRLPDDATDAAPPDAPPVDSGECPGVSKCVEVPAGWQLVTFDREQRRACASGYGQPTDVESVNDLCTCKCTETAAAGCGGDPYLSVRTDNTCGTNSSYYQLSPADAGSCLDIGVVTGINPVTTSTTQAMRNRRSPIAAICGAATSEKAPLAKGRLCKAEGATCSVGVCAEPPPAGIARCVSKQGDEPCPAGFTKKSRGGSAIGSDTRGCGPCTCAPTPAPNCNDELLEIFTDNGCTKGGVALPPNTCVPADGGSFAAYRWSGRDGGYGGCLPTAPPPLTDGGLTLAGEITICCAAPADGG